MSEQMKLVVAVSGGVDSVCLLNLLVNSQHLKGVAWSELSALRSKIQDPRAQIVVAHFDHGIREGSADDEKLVRGLAERYGLKYESKRVELGPGISEDQARQERYNFLRRCCKKYDARLVTAHHQDDLIETILINLIRGTGWRGLVSLGSDSNVLRPLLNVRKEQLLTYAKKNRLEWHEDSTNADTVYLRNYVRHTLLPKMIIQNPSVEAELLKIYRRTTKLKGEIATELQNIVTHRAITAYKYHRYPFIMWPDTVAREVIYALLTNLDPAWHPNTLQLERALLFIKTGQAAKELIISKHLKLTLEVASVQFKNY